MDAIDPVREDARKKAVYAFSTAYIFEKRAIVLGRQLKILSLIALLVPLLVASIVLGFGKDSWALPVVLTAAAVMGIVQSAGFAFSLACKWEDKYAYALESMNANYSLADRYDKLTKNTLSSSRAKTEADLLEKEYEARATQDNKQPILDEEKRMGMCAAFASINGSAPAARMYPLRSRRLLLVRFAVSSRIGGSFYDRCSYKSPRWVLHSWIFRPTKGH